MSQNHSDGSNDESKDDAKQLIVCLRLTEVWSRDKNICLYTKNGVEYELEDDDSTFHSHIMAAVYCCKCTHNPSLYLVLVIPFIILLYYL